MRKIINKSDVKVDKHIIHCDICHLEKPNMVEFKPKTRGTNAWICTDCLKAHEPNGNIRWTALGSSNKFEYQFIFNIVPQSIRSHALFVSRDYHLNFIGSETSGLCRYETLTYPNLHGVKSVLNTIDENRVVTEETWDKYQSISITHGNLTGEMLREINTHKQELFEGIEQGFVEHPELSEQLFGGLFLGGNAETLNSEWNGQHWLTMTGRTVTLHNVTFGCGEQMFYLTNLLKDWLTILMEIDEKSIKAMKKKLEKTTIKYLKGEANCQRPERNKKK